MNVKRAYSYEDISRKRFNLLDFQGEWKDHIGKPEVSGSWIVYGLSGNGKTSYVMQLVKYLCLFGRVHYNSLEEGMRQSFKHALERNNIKSVGNKFTFQSESYDDLIRRLDRKRMPKIIVIDSLQYFFRKKRLDHYFELLNKFPNTLFIFISHAKGSSPKGELADDIRFHSDVKLHVKDFMCTVETSRFGGSEPYLIWKEGYEQRQLKLLR